MTTPPPSKKPAPGALINAAKDENTALVRSLLQQGADVNERDYTGNSALNYAASRGYLEIVRVLCENNANVDSRNNKGETPLIGVVSAFGAQRETVTRLLLSKGANMDIKNNEGQTAMDIAIKSGRTTLIEIMKAEGVKRKRLAAEYAKAAEDKRRAAVAEKQERLKKAGPKAKPKLGPKPPEAA